MRRSIEILYPDVEDIRKKPEYWLGHTLDDECPIVGDDLSDKQQKEAFLILKEFIKGHDVRELSSFTTGTFDSNYYLPETVVKISTETLHCLTEATSRQYYLYNKEVYLAVVMENEEKLRLMVGFKLYRHSSGEIVVVNRENEAKVFPGKFEIGDVRHKCFDGNNFLQKYLSVDLIAMTFSPRPERGVSPLRRMTYQNPIHLPTKSREFSWVLL